MDSNQAADDNKALEQELARVYAERDSLRDRLIGSGESAITRDLWTELTAAKDTITEFDEDHDPIWRFYADRAIAGYARRLETAVEALSAIYLNLDTVGVVQDEHSTTPSAEEEAGSAKKCAKYTLSELGRDVFGVPIAQ